MAIAMVDQQSRSPRYRVESLCRQHSFEEVAYLLWHGELPTREQLAAQNRAERAQRAIGPRLTAAIADQPFAVQPLDTVRTMVRLLGGEDPAGEEAAPEALHARALRLFAVLPTIIAVDQRRRHGLGAVAPRDHLGYAANFLSMIFGRVPEPQVVAAFETALILYAGESAAAVHGGRAADLHGSVASEVGALKRSPRTGAGAAVMEMLNEIAIPDNAEPWVSEALAEGRVVTGFGLSDEDGDARAPVMRVALGMIAALRGGQVPLAVHDALAAAMYQATGLHPDLDYPAALAFHLIGLDVSSFAPIFAAASLPGWTARITERLAVPPA